MATHNKIVKTKPFIIATKPRVRSLTVVEIGKLKKPVYPSKCSFYSLIRFYDFFFIIAVKLCCACNYGYVRGEMVK